MPENEYLTATRTVYDRSASQYVDDVGTQITSEFETPLDRAMLNVFAERLAAQPHGVILDIGCGPGRVAAYLSERGLTERGFTVRGTDIAPGMINAARSAHPHLQFDEGSLISLPAPSASVAGAVYWYSIITTPLEGLRDAWTELDRVLAINGEVLVAFQSGEGDSITRNDAYGSGTDLTLYRHSIKAVVESMTTAGLDVRAQIHRRPELAHETGPQAFLFARRAVSLR